MIDYNEEEYERHTSKRIQFNDNAIIEATTDIKKLTANQLVSKLHAYKVANEIVQEPQSKDKIFTLSNKAIIDVDSDDDNLDVEILNEEMTMLSTKIQKLIKRNMMTKDNSSSAFVAKVVVKMTSLKLLYLMHLNPNLNFIFLMVIALSVGINGIQLEIIPLKIILKRKFIQNFQLLRMKVMNLVMMRTVLLLKIKMLLMLLAV